VAAYLPTYTGNITGQYANLSANVSAVYFVGNGALLTGITSGGGGIANLYADTSPKLSANLNVNGKDLITSVSNGNIYITPNGNGYVHLNSQLTKIGGAAFSNETNSAYYKGLYTDVGIGSGPAATIHPAFYYDTYNGTWVVATDSTITGNAFTANTLGYITVSSLYTNGIYGTFGSTTPYVIQYPRIQEKVYSLGTSGGTKTLDSSNGTVQKITLNSALTLNAPTMTSGETITLIITGGTAYTSITQGTGSWKWAYNDKTLTGVASCIDIVSIFYDGTYYYASINKGFA